MTRLALLLILAAMPASAQVFTGFYDFTGTCSEGSDSRIEVRATEIAFWESTCTLGAPRALAGMGGAVQYTATCTGEGQSWTREFVLMQREDGGLILLRPGGVTEYQRCD